MPGLLPSYSDRKAFIGLASAVFVKARRAFLLHGYYPPPVSIIGKRIKRLHHIAFAKRIDIHSATGNAFALQVLCNGAGACRPHFFIFYFRFTIANMAYQGYASSRVLLQFASGRAAGLDGLAVPKLSRSCSPKESKVTLPVLGILNTLPPCTPVNPVGL